SVGVTGKKHVKTRSFAGTALQPDRTAVVVHNLGHDRKSQDNSVLLRSKEGIEYLFAQFRRDPRPGILNLHRHAGHVLSRGWSNGNAQLAAGAVHGFVGVADQVNEHLLARSEE